MKKYWIWLLLAGGGIAIFFVMKKKGSSATSASAKATTTGTTTGKAPQKSTKSAASKGAGWSGWLTQGQDVLKNTSNNIKTFQDAGSSIRSLGGTFSSLFSGGGGKVSPNTSGGGAGVPIDYENGGPTVSQDDSDYWGDYSGGENNSAHFEDPTSQYGNSGDSYGGDWG